MFQTAYWIKFMKQTQPVKVAINGFGRIGRAAFKAALEGQSVKVVAINDLVDTATLAHLLKYDSVYGFFEKKVEHDEKNLIVDGIKYPALSVKEASSLPWRKLGVDVVLECTGRYVNDGAAKVHWQAGAKKVIVSAPAKGKGAVPTYVFGSNEKEYKGENLISMGSCTTNCIAPITKVIQENFGIKQAFFTTIHAYTADQNLVDGPHKDLRRARSAAYSIIPTSSGAAISVAETQPNLKGRFDGLAIRVPVICGSLTDLVFLLRAKTTVQKVNAVLKKAARSKELARYLTTISDEIVSADIIKNTASSIVDLNLTMVVNGDLVKVLAWYDNEWAYSLRLVEMAQYIMRS